jgi:D-serine deaminase-like pyridoxal phosphate-dependent protein
MKISKPVAFIDKRRCRENIQFMAGKLNQLGIAFRPHFKTHQSTEIGSWYRDFGVTKITVSSPDMASYFINSGWNDITIAFPVSPAQFKIINELADRSGITVFINDLFTAQYFANNISHEIEVMIEIDPGLGRSGLLYEQQSEIQSIYDVIRESNMLRFYGFYIHDGRTYRCKGKKEVIAAIQPAINILNKLKDDYPGARACLGDTPSASLAESFPGIDELSPGNHIFYDLMQLQIGSCTGNRIAYAVGCPVAQVKEELNEIVIYGGAVHFSTDHIIDGNQEVYGIGINVDEYGFGSVHQSRKLIRLSQEHGIMHGEPDWIGNLKPGDTIYIAPAHSCLSSNLFDHYQSVDGKRFEKRILS